MNWLSTNGPQILIILGAAISVAGTVWATHNADLSQSKQKQEIIDEHKSIITGGNSFIFLRPMKVGGHDETIFMIEFRGKYPIYDVSVSAEVFDLQGGRYVKTGQTMTPLGTVQPLQTMRTFERVALPISAEGVRFGRRYFFSISSRNGTIEEDVYMRKNGSTYLQAFKVVRMTPNYGQQPLGPIGEILRPIKEIDRGFPIQEFDHLEGDSGWNAKYDEERQSISPNP